MTRLPLIAGLLVGMAFPARAADTLQPTGLWSMQIPRVFFTVKHTLYDGKDYRFTCRFLKDPDVKETTPVTLCVSEKSAMTGDLQIMTRDVDGDLKAISVVADIRNIPQNSLASMMDMVMFMYMLKKTDEDKALDKAKIGRRRLIDEVARVGRTSVNRDDITIRAYMENSVFHADFDRPASTESDE